MTTLMLMQENSFKFFKTKINHSYPSNHLNQIQPFVKSLDKIHPFKLQYLITILFNHLHGLFELWSPLSKEHNQVTIIPFI
jgi:hypothetical protein